MCMCVLKKLKNNGIKEWKRVESPLQANVKKSL